VDPLTATQPEIARIFGVSTRTIQRWEELGLASARVEGGDVLRYDVPRAVAWRVEQEAARVADAHDEPGSFEAARARKELALAQIREIELAELQGKMVRVAQRDATVREALEAGDRILKASPRRLANRWARRLKVTEPEAIELIEELVEDVRCLLRERGADGDDAAA
jgi:phage terminase Nu1 subunit (DNA packaging protein)